MGGVATRAYSPSTQDCWRYARAVTREEVGVDLSLLCNGQSLAWMTAQATLLLPPMRGVATPTRTNDELLRVVEARFGLRFPYTEEPPYRTSTMSYATDYPYEVVWEDTPVWIAGMAQLTQALSALHDPDGDALLMTRLEALGPRAMEPYLLEFLWSLHEIQNARLALAEFAR